VEALLDLAIKKLTTRSYSYKWMENYLTEAGFDQNEIKPALAKLLDWDYLNDKRLALELLYCYTKKKPKGRLFLRQKLQEEKIGPDLIEDILEEYDSAKEFEIAQQLSRSYLKGKNSHMITSTKTTSAKIKASLGCFLERKGVTLETIERIIDHLDLDEASS
jgi:SOS response regulatory protein OraA/RecX